MKNISPPRKLKRDHVISIINGKDMVGIYWADTNGSEILFECSPWQADMIVAVFNGKLKTTHDPRTCENSIPCLECEAIEKGIN